MKLFSRAKHIPSEGRRARQPELKNATTAVRSSAFSSASQGANSGKEFLRNRTLTGVMSQEIGSDSEGTRAYAHKIHRHRRTRRSVLIVATFFIVLGALLFSNRVMFSDITVLDNNASFSDDDKKSLKESFNTYLSEHPAQLFMLTLQTKEFLTALQVAHPEIKTAYFQSEFFGLKHTLRIGLRTPLLEWNVAGKKYYVDSQGVAYVYNYFKAPSVSVEDQSGITFSDSTNIPRRVIAYIGQLTGALQTNGIGTVSRVVIPASSREVDVYLEGREYSLKTHIDRDAYETAGGIKSILTYLDQRGVKPAYVDVRIEGKAFYK